MLMYEWDPSLFKMRLTTDSLSISLDVYAHVAIYNLWLGSSTRTMLIHEIGDVVDLNVICPGILTGNFHACVI